MTAQSGLINRREPLRRSAISAAMLSLIVPGFGQFYVGRARCGLVFMALYGLSSLVVLICLAGILPRFGILSTAMAALLLVYLVALIDAASEARKLGAYTPKAHITAGTSTWASSSFFSWPRLSSRWRQLRC